MLPKPLAARFTIGLVILAAIFLMTGTAFGQNDSTNNYFRIDCPTTVTDLTPDTFIDVPVYIANSAALGGFSYGFNYNSDHIEIDSVISGPALVTGGFGSFLFNKNTAANTVLVGWINFVPALPLVPHAVGAGEAVVFTLRFKIQPGATDATVNVDTAFVPPAGFLTFSLAAGGDIAPGFIDCGAGDIILGSGGGPTNQPPVAICQPITVAADAGCTAPANVDNGSNDPDAGDVITLTQIPPGPYPLGVTNVMLVVSDGELADTCETTVTVNDVTDPVVTCPANVTVGNDAGVCGAVVNFAPTATDNCDGSVTINAVPPSGSVFPVGETTVTVTATDDSGNDATCQFTVTVNDTENPVAICPGDIDVVIPFGETEAIVNFLVSATDNCEGATAVAVPASGSAFPIGTTAVNVTATDGAGNTGLCSFNVNVTVGNAAPVVSDIPDQTIDQGQQFAQINLDDYVTDADNADNELIWTVQQFKSRGTITVTIDENRVATIVIDDFTGSAVFTFRATDPEGAFDEDQATFTVNALVNDPPVVSDIPDQTILSGESFATIDLDDYVIDPDNADNELTWSFSGNTLLTVVIDTGNVAVVTYPGGFIGSETITFTATDPGALFDSDAATFTVNEVLFPDFNVDATPEVVNVAGGDASPFSFDIEVQPIDGFIGAVSLAVNGLPAGATGDFSLNPVEITGPAASSTFSGTISAETPPGTYDVVFLGTEVSRAGVHADTVQLVVEGCAEIPFVVVSDDYFELVAEEGNSPLDQLVYITNGATCGTLYWTTAVDQPWVTVDPTSGDVEAGATPGDAMDILFNTASLAPGNYLAYINVMPIALRPRANADEGVQITIDLTITPKPISDDTVYVDHVAGYAGTDVAVPLTFRNYEELAGMSAGLTWNSPDVTLDSVSYAGSRVEYIATKITTINNGDRTLALGVLRIPPEPLVATGSGLWGTLWFSIDGGAAAQTVTIDTTFIAPGVELLFNDVMANSIYPQFSAGSIEVLVTEEICITGTVEDGSGSPIADAIVELWYGDALENSTTSGADGSFQFCFMTPPADGYSLRAYKPGYYPDFLGDVSLPSDDNLLALSNDGGEVVPTYEWVDLYCQGEALDNGLPIPVGSVVEAYDPTGVLCGQWTVTTPGTFGFMPVYVDDPYSPSVDEGCVLGDTITLLYNGEPVELIGDPLVWTGNGDRYSACFEYPATPDIVTKCIHLAAGWNLISFNVELPTSELEALFADVLDNTDVILSFESVGMTYDPDLPDFSTLWDVDNFHGYWFRMDSPDSICVTGRLVDATTAIALENNWNLVSYLPEDERDVPTALTSIWGSVVVVLGYEGGGLSYDPAHPELATLNAMKPLFGYWIKTNAPGSLIYDMPPTFARTDATYTAASYVPRVQTSNTWINLFGQNVRLNGQTLPAGTVIEAYNEAGALVGEYTVRQNGKFGFMPVYGPDSFSANNDAIANSGKISFKVNGEEAAESVQWTNNGDRVAISEFTTINKGGVLPTSFSLNQNYPNPFNPETSIEYTVASAAQVEIAIYNVLGAKIKTLVSEYQPAGSYQVKWHGDDVTGNTVASGVYFYKMTAGSFTEVKKMTLLK